MTIGVGRNLTDVGIDDTEVEFLLRRDIARVVSDLDRRMGWWALLDENRQLVLADMCFNMGITRLLTFKRFLSYAMAGDYPKAAYEMLQSVWAAQVGKRAVTLAAMMREGTPTA